MQQHPHPHTSPQQHAIDPAIAGGQQYQMSQGDTGHMSDQGQGNAKGRRELSTSKRAAQNRAAQVCTTTPCASSGTDSPSAPSASVKKSTSSSSRTRSKSSSSYASFTRRSRRRTISSVTTSSISSPDSSRPRARYRQRPPASISRATAKLPIPTWARPRCNLSPTTRYSRNRMPTATATTVASQIGRLGSSRWPLKQQPPRSMVVRL
jgi:hypothetical protein